MGFCSGGPRSVVGVADCGLVKKVAGCWVFVEWAGGLTVF